MVNDRTFIFHECIPCDNTSPLVTRSSSSVKVTFLAWLFSEKTRGIAIALACVLS